MGLLVAGTKYRGEFEERLKKLMEEIKQSDEIILFIDEVHTLIGAGAAEGAIDAANILKPALSRGELQVWMRLHGIMLWLTIYFPLLLNMYSILLSFKLCFWILLFFLRILTANFCCLISVHWCNYT